MSEKTKKFGSSVFDGLHDSRLRATSLASSLTNKNVVKFKKRLSRTRVQPLGITIAVITLLAVASFYYIWYVWRK